MVQEEHEDLYLEILDRIEGSSAKGITDNQVERVQNLLEHRWQTNVSIYAGEVGVTQENAFAELMRYEEMLSLIPRENEVLLDFTHGFRSMPILLMSALRFRSALAGQVNLRGVRLIYGELNRDRPSPVHVLDDIWTGLKVAQAARLFFEKFEGEELAQEVAPFWPKGEKAIRRLSKIIQANMFDRIEDPLRQLGNAIKASNSDAPPWFASVKQKLKELHKRLHRPTLPCVLLNLSMLLKENRLPGQAYIALDETLTEAILEANQCRSEKLTDEDRRGICKDTITS